jgi:hypothetical protein
LEGDSRNIYNRIRLYYYNILRKPGRQAWVKKSDFSIFCDFFTFFGWAALEII